MKKIPESTVRRLSQYHRFVQDAEARGLETISSADLARRGGTTSAQVRKDLSLFGSFGKRGRGYPVSQLRERLRDLLGLSRSWQVGLVGAGKVGAALFSYTDFQRRGFEIRAVFDADPEKIGQSWGGLTVLSHREMERVLREERIEIVIVAVPAASAQAVVDRVVSAGVQAILNFAPVRLRIPAEVALRNVDMAVELEGLSFALHNRRSADPGCPPSWQRLSSGV